jgi:hypothetical protein
MTLTTLKSDLEIVKRDSEDKESEIKQLKKEIKSLAASVDELKEAKLSASSEVKRLQEKLKKAVDDGKEKDKTIEKLQSDVTDMESKMSKLRSEASGPLARGASTYGLQRVVSVAQPAPTSSESSTVRGQQLHHLAPSVVFLPYFLSRTKSLCFAVNLRPETKHLLPWTHLPQVTVLALAWFAYSALSQRRQFFASPRPSPSIAWSGTIITYMVWTLYRESLLISWVERSLRRKSCRRKSTS